MQAAFHLLQGFRAVAVPSYGAAASSFGAAFALTDAAPPDDDYVLLPNLGIAAWLIDDDERTLRLHAHQLTAARRTGALNMVEHALTRMFLAQVATGSWTSASAGASEALRLADSTGHAGLTALPTAQLALLAALRGDPAASSLLGAVASLREAHPIGITDVLVVDLVHWADALGATGEAAVHHFSQVRLPMVRRMAALDLFDAAFRAGLYDVLRSWLAEVESFASGTGVAAAVAVAAHGRALLADDDATRESLFRAALAAHSVSSRSPDRARTELAFDAQLRRARRRVDARLHLRAALTVFEDLGAVPFVERAAQELRASGETARRRDAVATDELTPQERQVAALVRQGLSNRDAAAQLFLSPRTVDFHLRNVFQKLGVTSRAELVAMQFD